MGSYLPFPVARRTLVIAAWIAAILVEGELMCNRSAAG